MLPRTSGIGFPARSNCRSCPDQFRHAPGLGDATPGLERLLGIEDLADRPDAGLPEVLVEAVHHRPGFVAALGKRLEPGVHERAEEPGPDGALVVGAVPGPEVAVVRSE